MAACLIAVTLALGSASAQDTQALFAQGYELYKGGLYKGAVKLFEEGLAAEPDNGLAHFYLAECQYKLGNLAGALDHYRQAAALLPPGEEATRSTNLALAIEAELGTATEEPAVSSGTAETTSTATTTASTSGPDWNAVVADQAALGDAIKDFYNTNHPVQTARNTTITRVWGIKLDRADAEGALVICMIQVEALGRMPGQFKSAARLAPDGAGYTVVAFEQRQPIVLETPRQY
jgi:tetratricopeptide (TPR) repeat protein